MQIILMGYMGSGKSTIGKELANKIDCKFIDLDDYISDKEEYTINSLFLKIKEKSILETKEKSDRPLIKNLKNDQLKEFIAKAFI